MKKIWFVVFLLVISTLTACNLPLSSSQPGAQNPAPGGPAEAQSQNSTQQPVQLGQSQATPTPAQGYKKVVLGDGKMPEIRSIRVTNKVVYYGNSGCEPRQTEIRVTMYDKDRYSARYGYYIDGKPADAYAMPNSPMAWEYWVSSFPGGEVTGEHTFVTTLDSSAIEQMLKFANLPWAEHTFQVTAAFDETPDTANRSWLYVYSDQVKGYDNSGDYLADGPVFPIIKVLPCYPAPTPVVVTLLPTSAPGSDVLSTPVTLVPELELPTDTPTPTPLPMKVFSGYVTLYDGEGVDLENSGGTIEMVYSVFDGSTHYLGQAGNGGTAFAPLYESPTYEICATSISGWSTSVSIAQGNFYCYKTDQGNYGWLRIDKLEQEGNGEIRPWAATITFATWVP